MPIRLLILASAWTLDLIVVIPPAGSPAATPSGGGEVVVTGERTRRVTLLVDADRKTGAKTCRLKRASGDGALDAALCGGATECARPGERTGELEACFGTRVDAIMHARYPGRTFAPLKDSDRPR